FKRDVNYLRVRDIGQRNGHDIVTSSYRAIGAASSSVTNTTCSRGHLGLWITGYRDVTGERKYHCVIVSPTSSTTLDSRVTRQRQIDIEIAHGSMCLSRGSACQS